jgi:hypothetical protein
LQDAVKVAVYWVVDNILKSDDEKAIETFAVRHSLEYQNAKQEVATPTQSAAMQYAHTLFANAGKGHGGTPAPEVR